MTHDIQISLSGAAPEDAAVDALVLFVPEKGKAFASTQAVDGKMGGALASVIKDEHFNGKIGDQIVYHTGGAIRAGRVILAGLGKKDKWNAENVRRAASTAALAARNAACARVAFTIPGETGLKPEVFSAAIVDGALLGTYKFVKFRTKEEDIEPEKRITSITLLTAKNAAVQAAVARAQMLAEATCFARDLVNEPANELNPQTYAEIARKTAKAAGLGFRVIEAPELAKLGAGAILGVGSGSKIPPRLVELSYKCGKKNAKKVALVGKGITFDSGGLSLKPSKYMETMKCDMAGSAAVLAAMKTLPAIKPHCDVIGVLCLAENMPSGSAIRPGDVLKAMNGKTIEVINTDAEGRLVLADGLSWAVKQGATEIVDLATLTGAVIIALGPYISGVLSNDPKLSQAVIEAGGKVGEVFWELPIPEDYDFMIKSDIADMKNLAANSEAGSTQGALFLKEFVGKAKWAHLDIAGPAWYDKEHFYNPKNGSGFGVRTLLQYLSR